MIGQNRRIGGGKSLVNLGKLLLSTVILSALDSKMLEYRPVGVKVQDMKKTG